MTTPIVSRPSYEIVVRAAKAIVGLKACDGNPAKQAAVAVIGELDVALEAAEWRAEEAERENGALEQRCADAIQGAWPNAEDADPDAMIRILREKLEEAERERDKAKRSEHNWDLITQDVAEQLQAATSTITALRREVALLRDPERHERFVAITLQRDTLRRTVEGLMDACERVTENLKRAVAGKPVRDMAETLAEASQALTAARGELDRIEGSAR